MLSISQEDKAHAKIIWDYMQLRQPPRFSEVTIAMGVTNLGVAWRCAELWQQKLTNHFIFSGYAAPGMNITEAELLANEAINCGVPKEVITLEKEASDSAKNFLYGYKKIKTLNLPTETVTVVSKPYMERRAYAIAGAQWPDAATSFYFTSYHESLEAHLKRSGAEVTIPTMLGDLKRIKEYPAKGWQIAQTIPPEVWQAYESLVASWKIRDIRT